MSSGKIQRHQARDKLMNASLKCSHVSGAGMKKHPDLTLKWMQQSKARGMKHLATQSTLLTGNIIRKQTQTLVRCVLDILSLWVHNALHLGLALVWLRRLKVHVWVYCRYLLPHGTDQLFVLRPVVASLLLELLLQSLQLTGHGSLHLHCLHEQKYTPEIKHRHMRFTNRVK